MDTSRIANIQRTESSISELPGMVSELQCERLFLVLDEVAYAGSGAKEKLNSWLQHKSTLYFAQFELNPKLEDVIRGVELCRDFKPQLVIAVGGGTAIDLAKLIGTLSVQSDAAADIITGRCPIENPGPPLIAIPTTAGTGSEATHFAVAYVAGEKFSCAHPTLLPDFSIVDPTLTYSLPKKITAATGLDAFCQAIESIWAVGATNESIGWASEAATLSYQNLVQATQDPTPGSRAAMSRAAHLAGKAINISKTTASHALSYYLTSHYDIPHGMAVAMTLSQMLRYNADVSDTDCADPRGATDVRNRIATICRLLNADDVKTACTNIRQMVAALDCPVSLADAGITQTDDIRDIIDSVNLERMSNNPRQSTAATLLELLAGETTENPEGTNDHE